MNFTKDRFLSFYQGKSNYQDAALCYDSVSAALSELGILTDLTLIGAISTVRVEAGYAFKPIREYASGQAYENRHDLGNYVPGDGQKYRGAGWLQLTGRANYQHYSDILGVDIICHPELALGVDVSAKILAHYFKDRGCDVACNNKDWTRVRELVNGGHNGLDLFLSVVNQYLAVSGIK